MLGSERMRVNAYLAPGDHLHLAFLSESSRYQLRRTCVSLGSAA
jgi:hypothetical protein